MPKSRLEKPTISSESVAACLANQARNSTRVLKKVGVGMATRSLAQQLQLLTTHHGEDEVRLGLRIRLPVRAVFNGQRINQRRSVSVALNSADVV